MTDEYKSFHSYGELNFVLKFNDGTEEKKFYLPVSPKYTEFEKRFLQFTRIDPNCYSFFINDVELKEGTDIFLCVANPLQDFVVKCNKKGEIKKIPITFKFKDQEIKDTFYSYTNDTERVYQLLSIYFSLKPSNFKITQKKSHFVVTSQNLLVLEATDYLDNPVKIVYTDNSKAIDLKYYICKDNIDNCATLFRSDKDNKLILNKIVISKIETKGPLLFKPYKNKFLYKEEGKDEVKETTFEGAPIGRNLVRAIAKATKQNLDDVKDKILVIESDGTHISKVKFSKFVKNLQNVYMLVSAARYTFKIQRWDNLKSKKIEKIKEMCFDPYFLMAQVRSTISSQPGFVSFQFIKIKDKNGHLINDDVKIKDAAKNTSEFIVEVSEDKPVSAKFQLYNNEQKSQTLTVDPTESVSSVVKILSKNFDINPKFFHIFTNDYYYLKDTSRFIHYYSGKLVYNLSSYLLTTINYKKSDETFTFPLSIDFKFLTEFCLQKFKLYGKYIGFVDISKQRRKEYLLVYSTWEEKHIFPGEQYVARCRSKEDKVKLLLVEKADYFKMIVKLYKNVKCDIDENADLNLRLYTKDGLIELKKKVCDEKVSTLFEEMLPEGVKMDPKNILFLIPERGLSFDSTIPDILKYYSLLGINHDIEINAFIPPNISFFQVPGKDPQCMQIKNDQMVLDLKSNINRNPKMINILYKGTQVLNLSQPLKFFNPASPLIIEFIKEMSYNLIFNKKSEPVEEISMKLSPNESTTVGVLLKEALDLVNKNLPERKGKKLTQAQIRVTIKSTILSKEMEKLLLINEFGPFADATIEILEKFNFSVQGDGLVGFHFSVNDTILYVKNVLLKKLEVKDSDMKYYYLMAPPVAAEDDEKLSQYVDEEDLCFDLVPIQLTVRVTGMFPDFQHVFVFAKDLIIYDVKEYFAKLYDLEDPDSIDLVDYTTNEVADDNDDLDSDRVFKINFVEVDQIQLSEKYKAKIGQIIENNRKRDEEALITDGYYKCPFTFVSPTKKFLFDLILEKDAKCSAVKISAAEYIQKLLNDEQITFDDIIISLNDKEILSPDVLFQEYTKAVKTDPNVRFVVEKENSMDLTQSCFLLASTIHKKFFSSLEQFQ